MGDYYKVVREYDGEILSSYLDSRCMEDLLSKNNLLCIQHSETQIVGTMNNLIGREAGWNIPFVFNAQRNFLQRKCISQSNGKLFYSAKAANSVLDRCQQLSPGDKIRGYTIEKVVPINELNLVSVLLNHDKTSAKHLHVAREDKNNVFSVMFRTTPMDSTGVPHILEHTALCGSSQYPVRDPFFKMLNRSLSTFMNAMTASDWTMYPFSSQNTKDFRNLMSVYLDAAFKPLLREEDFRQEGWRLENEDANDKKSPIVFKGVVFNEMKGVFSSQHAIFEEAVQNHILPDHTYGVCSGGLPLDILDLTWEHLKDFHATHYHPSNSKFYTYGDQPLEAHLDMIEDQVLSKFERLERDTSVPRQPRWDKPKSVKIACHPNTMLPDASKQTTVSKAYLLTDIRDTYESNVLSVICSLLTSGPNSPFYQSLIESKIGSGYAPLTSYHNRYRDTWFSVGLEGIAEGDVDKVNQIIDETFQQVAKDGFPQERIDALLSQIELSLKHQTPTFGLHLSLSLAYMWTHDADPTDGLQINKFLQKFKKDLAANPQLIQEFVNKYFVENTHVLTAQMSPHDEYEIKQQAIESDKLKTMTENLTTQQKDEIFSSGLELAQRQNEEEDLSCLPSLQKTDIDKNVVRTHLEHVLLDGVNVQLCEQPTNEVLYFNGLLDISDLPTHLKPYISLFCSLVTRMGAGDLDYKQQSQQIEHYTGGLSTTLNLSTSPHDLNQGKQQIKLSSFCLKDNMQPMFKLWSDIFNSVHLDNVERVAMLLKMNAANSVNAISMSGHQFAMSHAASTLNEMSRLSEVLGGITQISFLKSLSENERQEPIAGYLQDIAQHLLNKATIKCSLNAEGGVMPKALDELQSFLTSLPGSVEQPADYTAFDLLEHRKELRKTHFTMDFSVNYAGMAVPTVEYTHQDHGCIRVMAALLRNKYLHREIREKGGAYGGGAKTDSHGALTFYSYRDPNSIKTVETMMSSVDWLAQGDFTQEHVDEALLSVFQNLDAPVAPGSKGQGYFVSEISDDMRQENRDKLLSVTKDSIQQAAEKYLRNPEALGVTVIGPENEAIKSDAEWIISGRENCCQLPVI